MSTIGIATVGRPYPTISGPIGDAPSAPTGDSPTTVPRPSIDPGRPREVTPTLGPVAPDAPAPSSGPICSGACDAPSVSPIPGPTIGGPIEPGGTGIGKEGDDCGCEGRAEEVKAFLSDVPAWVWVLIGAAIIFGRR